MCLSYFVCSEEQQVGGRETAWENDPNKQRAEKWCHYDDTLTNHTFGDSSPKWKLKNNLELNKKVNAQRKGTCLSRQS